MAALAPVLGTMLESCAATPVFRFKPEKGDTEIQIPIEKFKGSTQLLLRLANHGFDFLVVKRSDTEYKTLELKCSHEDQPLSPGNKNIFCNSHGSIFSLDGQVLKEPAQRPLMSLKTTFENNVVHIFLA